MMMTLMLMLTMMMSMVVAVVVVGVESVLDGDRKQRVVAPAELQAQYQYPSRRDRRDPKRQAVCGVGDACTEASIGRRWKVDPAGGKEALTRGNTDRKSNKSERAVVAAAGSQSVGQAATHPPTHQPTHQGLGKYPVCTDRRVSLPTCTKHNDPGKSSA